MKHSSLKDPLIANRTGILAFHKALSDKPRDPLVVAAFSLAVHNGGDIFEAVDIARRINKSHDSSFHEISEPQYLDKQTLKDEITDLAASVKSTLCEMTDEYFVSQAMSAYPQAPVSDLVSNFLYVSILFSGFMENTLGCYQPGINTEPEQTPYFVTLYLVGSNV